MSQTSAPQARARPVLFWTGSELLVFGEYADGGLYSVCGDAWRAMADSPVNMSNGMLSGPGKLCFENPNVPTNDALEKMAVYDYGANSFHVVPVAGAVAAKRQAFVFAGSDLIAWGGATENVQTSSWSSTNLGARYSMTEDRWHPITTQGAPSPRVGEGNAVWTGTQLVVWGGISGDTMSGPGGGLVECSQQPYDACARFGDGAIYDPQTDQWTAMSNAGAPAPRFGHVIAWAVDRLLVWGGSTYQGGSGSSPYVQYVDGALYDPKGDAWTPTAPAPFDASRMSDAPLWTGARLVVFDAKATGRAGWIYDPVANRWATMSPDPGLCSFGWGVQAGAVVALCSTRLARLDVVQNQWTTIELPTDAPTVPGGVLWTGNRWFVWGGYRLGPTPPNPCGSAPPGTGCDPPGPSQIETNEGYTLAN